MNPLGLRARRKALGLSVAEVAYAARIRSSAVVDPSQVEALCIDAALRAYETGGCREAARAASIAARYAHNLRVSRENVQRNRVDRPPPWPEHSGGVEQLSGQCVRDVATADGGGRLPMQPATQTVRNSTLAD